MSAGSVWICLICIAQKRECVSLAQTNGHFFNLIQAPPDVLGPKTITSLVLSTSLKPKKIHFTVL